MTRALVAVNYLVRNDEGQDLIEYCLVTALIAIAALVAIGSVGGTLNSIWWEPIARAF